MPYGDIDLGQHWFRQWLAAWRHQAITWTNVDLPSARSIGIHLSTILQEILQLSITKISWKITFLKFLWNLPGANELKGQPLWCCSWNIPDKIDQYCGCWCPGSMCCLVINNHGIDCVKVLLSHGEKISTTCATSISLKRTESAYFLCFLKIISISMVKYSWRSVCNISNSSGTKTVYRCRISGITFF